MKKFLVVTATADKRMPETQNKHKQNPIASIYSEETLLHSDYAKELPNGMYKTTVQTEKIENFATGKPVLWVTTITRIE